MNKIKSIVKNNIKVVVAFALGLFLPGAIFATTSGYLYDADEVSYSHTTSGLSANDVQAALNELNTMCYD